MTFQYLSQELISFSSAISMPLKAARHKELSERVIFTLLRTLHVIKTIVLKTKFNMLSAE